LVTIVFNDEEEDRNPGEQSKLEMHGESLKELMTTFYDWVHQVKLLISESRHERKASSSLKSRRPKSHRSKSTSDQAKQDNLDALQEAEEEDEDDDLDDNNTDDLTTQRDTSDQQDSSSNAMDSTRNNLEGGNATDMPVENAEANKTNAEGEPNPEIFKSLVSFEIIGHDTNTEKKFLENLNLEDANHLTEAEMKATVFNANKTIETLQNDLV
jgi:hypothetical protein